MFDPVFPSAPVASHPRRGAVIFAGQKLTEIATAAVVCISPTVAWLTYCSTRRDKITERRRRQLDDLEVLHAQLDVIRNWASTQYNHRSHDPSWYNPFWSVLEFPWAYVERFNRLAMAGEFPGNLTAAVVRLEAAARSFHGFLARQHESLGQADPEMKQRILASGAVDRSRERGAALPAEAVATLPGLSDPDRTWLSELYRRNKEIHTDGIGRAGEPEKLHDAWSSAAESMRAARNELRAGRDPWWFIPGHVLAVVFVSIGLLFLAGFWASLATDFARRQPPKTSARTPVPGERPDVAPRKTSGNGASHGDTTVARRQSEVSPAKPSRK